MAALYAPGIVAGSADASAGLAMVAAAAVFAFPLAIWLRYARQVNGAGGLYAFVEAAAGRRVALVQAGLWIVSYLLYLLYTTTIGSFRLTGGHGYWGSPDPATNGPLTGARLVTTTGAILATATFST